MIKFSIITITYNAAPVFGRTAESVLKQDYRNIFCNKQVAAAGIVYTASEFLIIYTSVNLLPVSFVAMFMRLAAPAVMLISAVRYHEQSVKNQLVFGLLALLFALPLIFI